MATATELQADILTGGAKRLGIRLSEAQIQRFVRYYTELARWNARTNLTAITDWEAVQSRHFLDSLSVAQALPDETLQSGRFIDIGSGGGFPGIPMKLAFPGMRGALLDSTAKKTAFLTHVCEALELRDISVITARAETAAQEAELRETFDVAFARAVSGVATLAELTLPFVRVGGLVVLHKKSNIDAELESARGAVGRMGGTLREMPAIKLDGLDSRTLVVLEKQRPSPEGYPRRPGMPAKRPLT